MCFIVIFPPHLFFGFLYVCFVFFFLFSMYNYWPSYLVYIVFLLLHCHFLFSRSLFLVTFFTQVPSPTLFLAPSVCTFLLLSEFCSVPFLSCPFFSLSCLIPPKWPISGSEVPHPSVFL